MMFPLDAWVFGHFDCNMDQMGVGLGRTYQYNGISGDNSVHFTTVVFFGKSDPRRNVDFN
jgi:hypothetical protein